jgi:hypothetical protein
VVAPDQAQARRYLDHLRARLPEGRRLLDARLAVSEERDAPEVLAAFRLLPQPAILVTVAMAYEGLDAPEVAVVASLTHIRSRPWLEQMIARATRVDPHAGPWEAQRALVLHPDDLLFRAFRWRIETEQGTVARQPRPPRSCTLPPWLRDKLAEMERPGIVPLSSNATGLRWDTLRPGPAFTHAQLPPEEAGPLFGAHEAAPAGGGTPSALERRLRHRIGEMVAAQVVEEETALRLPRGVGNYHRLNAVLKRVLGGKGRGEMTLAELEAALGWLERNRLAEHLHLLANDPRYVYRSAASRRGSAGAWPARARRSWTSPGRCPRASSGAPPVGKPAGRRKLS